MSHFNEHNLEMTIRELLESRAMSIKAVRRFIRNCQR